MLNNHHHRRIIAASRISESLKQQVYNDIRAALSPAERQQLDYWYSRTAIGNTQSNTGKRK